jgi:hypothetical protein
MLKKSFDLIKDAEINSSGHAEESLPIDRVHQSVNLSLKLLWCTCTMMMQKEK